LSSVNEVGENWNEVFIGFVAYTEEQ